nr:MAG TPA: hypothetical protein [Bacteriophage sp.]
MFITRHNDDRPSRFYKRRGGHFFYFFEVISSPQESFLHLLLNNKHNSI